MELRRTAKLILEDGSVFSGFSFGSDRIAHGEVVFNTGMIGYPEMLTDPSYHGQILTLTYPLIGNYGVPSHKTNDEILRFFESEKIQVDGLIIADYSDQYSHWNAQKSLAEWLFENDVPAIYGVDTRALTQTLRSNGTMLGKIIYGSDRTKFYDPNAINLAASVSVAKPVLYKRGKSRILVVDCGTKSSIIRAFLHRGYTVKRVPWNFDFTRETVDGIVLSNGPGDPKKCTETISNVAYLLSKDIPILGICLGSQILALAAGADTYKLKYGHRSQNQPCIEVGTNRCYITSQNHGYAVDADSLPQDWREWFYNGNDQTNEGIMHISKPFFGAQFHPEASPGPDDTEFVFDLFVRAMK